MRRNALIPPLAVLVAGLLASSPALAQPVEDDGDSHASPVDDPAMSTPAPPVESAGEPATGALWFYVKDGAKKGPVTTASLRQLVLDDKLETTAK